MEYSISYYLDTRRKKSDGTFPVKLRVYSSLDKKAKQYPTKFDLTEEQFRNAWETKRTRKEYRGLRRKMESVYKKADDEAALLTPFDFDQFERRLFRKKGDGVRLAYHYRERIQELYQKDQISTANIYELSEKSIKDFTENHKRQSYDGLTFFDITSKWLEDFEYHMESGRGRSMTTISIYLRSLRALFNIAIDDGEINRKIYPFGKRKYQVPGGRSVKKALNKKQLTALFHAIPQTPEEQKAKDFWFFSYACNGMNMKDIAMMRYSNIDDGKIRFIRAKTRRTSKQHQEPVTVYLNDYITSIMDQYGRPENQPEGLIFDIIEEHHSAGRQHADIKNFTRFVNQHIKKLAAANDLPEAISTYWARHSFCTNAIRKGATMEFIQESLGHSDIQTTQNYFDGFDDDTRKEFAESIMDF